MYTLHSTAPGVLNRFLSISIILQSSMALLIFTYFVFMINEMCNVGRKITSERSYDIGQTIPVPLKPKRVMREIG